MKRPWTATAAAATTIAVTMIAVAVGAAPMASGQPSTDQVAGQDFYLPPDPLPSSANGELIRSEPVALMAGLAPPGVAGTRIMYQSADTFGVPVATSGIVLTPTAPWLGAGSRPVVSYAVGTHGAGDNCAPSKLLTNAAMLDGSGVPMLEYGLPDIAALLVRGISVVVTDYQGLGTPAGHTYLQPVPEAHAVLDAVRATIHLGVVEPDAPVGIWGYSQGGGAAGAAAEQAASYAPDLDVRGTVVGGPSVDPTNVMEMLEGKSFSGFVGYYVNGLLAAYPRLAPQIMGMLNQQGQDFVRDTAGQCNWSTAFEYGFRPTTDFTVSGKTIIDELKADPEVRTVLDTFVLGGTPPADPVLITHNINDEGVLTETTRELEASWRRGGTDVTYLSVDTPPLLPEIGSLAHGAGAVVAIPQTSGWLIDRLTR